MTEHPRRRWVLSPVQVPFPGHDGTIRLRTTTPDDDESLANLLSVAYDANAIDFDPEANYPNEIAQWRTIDHADDAASRIVDIDGAILGASLISSELSAPFLYEIATIPTHRRRGVALALLSESVRELARRSEPAIAAWVTDGNIASERLLGRFGFRPTTPPLVGDRAIGIYRAAEAAADLTDDGILATAAEAIEPGAARLWLFSEIPRPSQVVRVRTTDVEIVAVAPGSDQARSALGRATPIGGYWFLAAYA